MTWVRFIPLLVVALLLAVVVGALLGSRLARRGGVITADRTPTRPPATPRLVPIGGCLECGAPVGSGHTGYCPKSQMRGGVGGVVTEDDLRHLTVRDMGMD